jgi:glycosyl transferase family 87
MATAAPAQITPPDRSAIPPALLNACFVLFTLNAAYFPIAWFSHWWIYNAAGLGIPVDFVNVWAAGRLVLDGAPALAYDWDIQKKIEVAVLGQDFVGYFAWHYPPPFLFVATFLAQFPYAVAFIGWMAISIVPYLAVVRGIVGRPFGLLLAASLPMVFNNMLVGQNGFLTAALIGATLYLVPVRPVLAGICLGLLSYKPQYGVLFPLVLIAAGYWRAFISAAVTVVVLAFASWLAFGTEAWQAFFHWMPVFSQAFLSNGQAAWWKLQSLYALLRYLGGTESFAWAVHWVFTAAIATTLVLMWRSRVPYTLKAAALAIGALLTTPYLFMYDMVVLAIPAAFLVRLGLKQGFRPYELPAFGVAAAMIVTFIFTGVPLGLGATLVVGALVLRRAGPWWRREPSLGLAPARA